MSAVTLETLRADFEAAKAAHNFTDIVTLWATDAEGVLDRRDRWKRAASIYQIAQDHGLQAAMLYKLSDGAIDPRGAA